jgi:2-polyprenyl-6-methoxyphenol hydroxylase-like FAD-dependent oxidoreductase
LPCSNLSVERHYLPLTFNEFQLAVVQKFGNVSRMTRQIHHNDFAGVTQFTNLPHQQRIIAIRRTDTLPPFELRRLPCQLEVPLPDAPDGTHLSSIVWTERAELAALFAGLPEDEFVDEIHERFGWGLGRIGVAGGRWVYPLTFVQAQSAIGPRLAG